MLVGKLAHVTWRRKKKTSAKKACSQEILTSVYINMCHIIVLGRYSISSVVSVSCEGICYTGCGGYCMYMHTVADMMLSTFFKRSLKNSIIVLYHLSQSRVVTVLPIV